MSRLSSIAEYSRTRPGGGKLGELLSEGFGQRSRTIELTGMDAFYRVLMQMRKELAGPILRKAMTAAVKPVVEQARENAPVNKLNELHAIWSMSRHAWTSAKDGPLVQAGWAKENVRSKVLRMRSPFEVRAFVGVSPEAFYATQFVEFGTSKQAKQEWLGPALMQTSGVMINNFNDVLKKGVLKAWHS